MPWFRAAGAFICLVSSSGLAAGEAFAQLAVQDLAGRGARHVGVGDEGDGAGALVPGHALAAPGDQLVLGRGGPGMADDDGMDGFAPGFVRHADDGHIHDAGWAPSTVSTSEG